MGYLNNTGLTYLWSKLKDKLAGKLDTTGGTINGDLTVTGTIYNDGLSGGSELYPVGSIYLSVNATDPATMFGGTWERIKDMFLLGAGDTYSAGATGGEAEVTLSTAQMPGHRHTNSYGGNFYGTRGSGSGEVASLTVGGGGFGDSGTNGGVVRAPTNSVGGGEAHNNMPPYLAVYMWKRTA